jgi:hypothetical protein
VNSDWEDDAPFNSMRGRQGAVSAPSPAFTLIAAGEDFSFSRSVLIDKTELMDAAPPGTFKAGEYRVQTNTTPDTFRYFLSYLENPGKALPALGSHSMTVLSELADEFRVQSLKDDISSCTSASAPAPAPEPTAAATSPELTALQSATARLSEQISDYEWRLSRLEAFDAPSVIPELYSLIEESRVDQSRFSKLESTISNLKNQVNRIAADSRRLISDETRRLADESETRSQSHRHQYETLALSNQEFLAKTTDKLSESARDVASKFSAIDELVSRFRRDYSGLMDVPLPFVENGKGIISHLSARCIGSNVHDAGLVRVTGSLTADDPLRAATNVVRLEDWHDFVTDDEPGQWVCLDFRPSSVRVDGYSITGANALFPRSWVVEVLADGGDWVEVDARSDAAEVAAVNQAFYYRAARPHEGRFVRFRQIGKNSSGNDMLQLRAWELFGVYRDVDPEGVEQRMRNMGNNLAVVRPRPVVCLWHAGLPLRGILHYLWERNAGANLAPDANCPIACHF